MVPDKAGRPATFADRRPRPGQASRLAQQNLLRAHRRLEAGLPRATAWASPGARERAESQRIEASFDAELGEEPDPAWRDDLDQLVFRGGRFMHEVVFFHRKMRTAILADLIENFGPGKVGGAYGWLARAADLDGEAPLDLRLTFLGRKDEARASFERILAWEPEKVILAHGRWYDRDGAAELRRAFRWLGSGDPDQGRAAPRRRRLLLQGRGGGLRG